MMGSSMGYPYPMYDPFYEAATEIRQLGTFTRMGGGVPFASMNDFFR